MRRRRNHYNWGGDYYHRGCNHNQRRVGYDCDDRSTWTDQDAQGWLRYAF